MLRHSRRRPSHAHETNRCSRSPVICQWELVSALQGFPPAPHHTDRPSPVSVGLESSMVVSDYTPSIELASRMHLLSHFFVLNRLSNGLVCCMQPLNQFLAPASRFPPTRLST